VAEVADGRCLPKIREFLLAVGAGQIDLAAVMCSMDRDTASRLWSAMESGLDVG